MNFVSQLIIIYRALMQKFFGFAKNIFNKLDGITVKYYFKTKKQKRIAIAVVIFFGLLLFISPVRARLDEIVPQFILVPILSAIISIFGVLLSFLIWILVKVAQYNGFIDAEPVRIGWQLVRDVCNMFFIIVLLVIAFGTVLGIQNYSYKNLLKKLIIMALLINFSKTITAFFIDFSQIIMLTFVSAFKEAAKNFTTMFGIEGMLNFEAKSIGGEKNIDWWSMLGAAIIGLILVIISCIVVIIFLLVLIVRIMYLWLLMVLSPLAYFLSTFPSGQQYASKWWKTFSEQLIIGPLLAFFLWLAMASAQVSGGKISLGDVNINNDEFEEESMPEQPAGKKKPTNPFKTKATEPASMLSVITGISLLIVGLMLAQEMGGAAGKIAGKGLAKLQAAGTGQLGPTPMRWARERIEGFKKAREASTEKRKQKAAEFGGRMYGVTQVPKAAWTGFKQTKAGQVTATGLKRVRQGIGYATVGSAAIATGPVGWAIGGALLAAKGDKVLSKKFPKSKFLHAHRQRIRDHKDGVQEASEQTEIDPKTGNIKAVEKNGYRYTKTAKGVQVEDMMERDADGMIKKDANGEEISRAAPQQLFETKKFADDMRMGFNRQYSAATTVIGKAAESRTQQHMDEFGVLSIAELRQVLTDTKATGEQKRGASMLLLQKEGFKDQDSLQKAKKDNFSNYPTLLAKFNETADKRYALWNNSKDQLQAKIADGRVDIGKQSTTTLDKNSVQLLSTVMGYKFKDALKSMNRTMKDQENIGKALSDNFSEEYNPASPDHKNDTTMRNAHFAVTADIMEASNYKTGGVSPDRLNDMIVNAKSESLANVPDEVIESNITFQNSFVENTSRAQLKSLQRSGLAPDKLRKYMQLLRSRNSKLIEEIEAEKGGDRELASIK